MKILVIVDPHLSSQCPSSRRDDYPATMLDKMEQVREIARKRKIDLVLVAGDLLHNKTVSMAYLVVLARILKSFSCPVYTTIGNHCIYYNNLDTLNRTPLGLLISAGAIQRLSHLSFPGVDIFGYDFQYEPVKPKVELGSGLNLLVAHQFVNQSKVPETFEFDELTDFDVVFLGHDHSFYEPMVYGKTAIIRPGALSRGTQHLSNSHRDIGVVVFDTDTRKIEFVKLKVQPFDAVFLPETRIILGVRKSVAEFVHDMEAGFLKKGVSLGELINDFCAGDEELKSRVNFFLMEYHVL